MAQPHLCVGAELHPAGERHHTASGADVARRRHAVRRVDARELRAHRTQALQQRRPPRVTGQVRKQCEQPLVVVPHEGRLVRRRRRRRCRHRRCRHRRRRRRRRRRCRRRRCRRARPEKGRERLEHGVVVESSKFCAVSPLPPPPLRAAAAASCAATSFGAEKWVHCKAC